MDAFWGTLFGNVAGFAIGLTASLVLGKPLTRWTAGRLIHQTLADPARQNMLEWLAWIGPTGWLPLLETAARANRARPVQRPLPGGGRDPIITQLRLRCETIEPAALRDRPVLTQRALGPCAARPLHLTTPLMLGCSAPPLSNTAWKALSWAATNAGTALRVGPEPLAGAPAPVRGPTWRAVPGGVPLGHWDLLEGTAVVELPAAFWQHLRPQELLRQVTRWRDLTQGMPVALAVPADDLTRHWERICLAGCDALVFDAAADALGSAGRIAAIQDVLGLSPLLALARVDLGLRAEGQRQRVSLVLAGRGLVTPGDFALALALGADAVALDGIALWALVENQLPKALPWDAPSALLTPSGRLRHRFNRRDGAKRLLNYLIATTLEMALLAKALGKLNLRDLSRNDIVALSEEAAALLALPWQGELPFPSVIHNPPLKTLRLRPQRDDIHP